MAVLLAVDGGVDLDDLVIPLGKLGDLHGGAVGDLLVPVSYTHLYCEKNSHKGIIIGKGGAMLKKVSSLARQDMERFMGTKVYLQTWVKVKENWRDNVNLIRNFGYRDE